MGDQRLGKRVFWTDSAEQRDSLDGFGRTTRFSGRIRVKHALFWTDSAEQRDFLDGFG